MTIADDYIQVLLPKKKIMKLCRREGIDEELAFLDFIKEEKAAAMEAIAQIRCGRSDDAIVTLERAFLPRWQDSVECEMRYREAMGRV